MLRARTGAAMSQMDRKCRKRSYCIKSNRASAEKKQRAGEKQAFSINAFSAERPGAKVTGRNRPIQMYVINTERIRTLRFPEMEFCTQGILSAQTDQPHRNLDSQMLGDTIRKRLGLSGVVCRVIRYVLERRQPPSSIEGSLTARSPQLRQWNPLRLGA